MCCYGRDKIFHVSIFLLATSEQMNRNPLARSPPRRGMYPPTGPHPWHFASLLVASLTYAFFFGAVMVTSAHDCQTCADVSQSHRSPRT